jgi:TonB family protein
MKRTTVLHDEPQRDHGISRMILLSAALHVVAIGTLIVIGYLRPAKPREPQVAAYEVTLIGSTGTGKRKAPAEKTPPAPQATGEKPAPPPAKSEPREAAPQKPQEKPKEEAKPKPQELPVENPRDVAKTIEPPKPKPAPVAQEKEPPKVVTAVKPVEKKLPPPEKKTEEVKVKEQAKPKIEARLAEKKEKPQDPPPPQPERMKVQEKKSEPPKTVEKPKTQSVAPKPEKKPQEPVKTTAKEKISEPKKTANSESAHNRPAAAEPAAKAAPLAAATQVRKDEEARDSLITSAVERVRTREEAVGRERDIAKAVDRVRQGVSDREEPGKETKKKPAAAGSNSKREGDDHVAKAKVYGPEFLAYTEDIKQRVKDNWIVVDRKPELVTVVQFGVEADGGVVDVELVKPSGDRSFDQSALRAVRSARLPPPPEAYREDFATQKVHMTFGGEE